MANNILIKDGNNVSVALHTIEDSTSVHFNQSIVTDVSGHTATVVSGAGQAVTTNMAALAVALHPSSPLPAGTNLLGRVSLADSQINVSVGGSVLVSVNNQPFRGEYNSSLPTLAAGSTSVAQLGSRGSLRVQLHSADGTQGIPGGTASEADNNAGLHVISKPLVFNTSGGNWDRWDGKVSIGNSSLTVGTHAVTQSGKWLVSVTDPLPAGTNLIGAVSIRGNVSIDDKVSISGLVGQTGTWTVQPGNTANTTPWLVSVGGNVSLTDNAPVSVRGGLIGQSGIWTVQPGNTANTTAWLVSVNGGVSLGGGAAVIGKVSVDNLVAVSVNGITKVHVCNAAPGGSGAMTQTVGAAVSAEGYPMLGSDGTLARRLLTTTGGALVVHVSNSQPAPSGISMTQTVDAAVTTQGYPMLGSDGITARAILVDTSGAQVITGTVITNQHIFTRPNDTTTYSVQSTVFPGNAGDLIANSTTNTAVKPLKFKVARTNGGMSYIRRARMFRTGTALATNIHNITSVFRLHLFNTNNEVSVAAGDNSAMLASPVSAYLGYIDLTTPVSTLGIRTGSGVSVAWYQGTPSGTGSSTELVVALSGNQVSVQGLLEARFAFVPIANEIFTILLDSFQS